MNSDSHLLGLRPEFCSHSARVMSFKTKKSLPKASRWPHPQSFPLTPEVLASAGYFHDPAEREPDRTTCWICGESMKGWAEDDDPWALHHKWSPNCPCARIALLEHQRDTQTPSWSGSPDQTWGTANEWFPRGQVLIDARLATFCGADGPWKHEGKKGIPTRLELARAGFHFTPNLFKKGRKFDVDDTTSCCYCNRSVTEWEVDDDPVSVHLKKGACIFFTAPQPADPPQPTKPPPKPSKKPTKNSRAAPSNSVTPAPDTSVDLNVEPDEATQTDTRKKKPSSAASSTTKTSTRRVLASSTKGPTAADESAHVDPEPAAPVHSKQTRASRKLVSSVNPAPSSPEFHEQPASKPPVTLAKSTRLSRSTSKPPSTAASQRSSASTTIVKTRTRASSNASITLDPHLEDGLAQTDDEEPVVMPKKPIRQRKASKPVKPAGLSVTPSEVEDLSRPIRQVTRGRAKMPENEECPSPAGDRQPAQDAYTRHTRSTSNHTQSKAKANETGSGAAEERSASQALKHLNGSRSEGASDGLPGPVDGFSAPSLLGDYDPQAPQLYAGRLPVAEKTQGTPFGLRVRSQDPRSISASGQGPSSRVAEAEAEAILKEYLSQSAGGPIPPGWLPNPYNPSRPFPPLTAEEARMPLSEYFPYRARQEEEAFLEWIEERRMKPWLEAVERGKKMVEEMIQVRKSQRRTTTTGVRGQKENKLVSTEFQTESQQHVIKNRLGGQTKQPK